MTKKTAKLIDGKKLSNIILDELKKKIDDLPRRPGLAVVLVGTDKASQLYVKNKKKACESVGIEFHEYIVNEEFIPGATQDDVLQAITWLNNDDSIDGIIIQLPVPDGFDAATLIDTINPEKDVDGFHDQNRKEFLKGEHHLTPPLIDAINICLQATEQPLEDKQIIVVSKNRIFSEPLVKSLEKKNLNVTSVHPDDANAPKTIASADCIISITGRPGSINKDMIKSSAIVIDAGTTLTKDGKIIGDTDPSVAEVASWYTPVPGGVGPLTVAMLLKNVFDLAAKKQNN